MIVRIPHLCEKCVSNRESLAPSQNLIHKSKWFFSNEIIFSQKMLSYWGEKKEDTTKSELRTSQEHP